MIAETCRRRHRSRARRGAENARYLQVAEAIERCDWPKLARLIRAEAHEKFTRMRAAAMAQLLSERQKMLAYARRLARKPPHGIP